MCLKSWLNILSYTGYISYKIKIKAISKSTSLKILYSMFYSVTSDWKKKFIPASCSISERQSQSLLLFSPSVMFYSLLPHGLHHARLPCSSPSPRVAQTHINWVDDAIQPSHPLLPSSPPALNLSQHKSLFQWDGVGIRWPKYWTFSFSICPSNGNSE